MYLPPYSSPLNPSMFSFSFFLLISVHFIVKRLVGVTIKIHGEKDIADLLIDASDADIDAALDEVCQTTCNKVTHEIVNAADRHSQMSLRGILI